MQPSSLTAVASCLSLSLFTSCQREDEGAASRIALENLTVLQISQLPEEKKIPYPDAAAICKCRHENLGGLVLVVVPAVKNRKPIVNFGKISQGSVVRARLVPWQERPPHVRAMFIANDFPDDYDLPIYFTQSFSFP